jgi:hypothetical protein
MLTKKPVSPAAMVGLHIWWNHLNDVEEKHAANSPSWRANYQYFLHHQDIGWSRSCVHVSRWSCKLRRTIKHTIIYPGSGPYYEVIAIRPAFLY